MGEKRLPGSNKAKKPSFNFFFVLPFSPEYTQPRLLITEVKTAGSSFSTQQTAPEVSFQLMLIAFKQEKKRNLSSKQGFILANTETVPWSLKQALMKE